MTGVTALKRLIISFLFFFLFWTGSAHGRLVTHAPEAMIEEAQFIVAGQVIEQRADSEQPEFVVRVDTVYKGELGRADLAIPLPHPPGMPPQPGIFVEAPELGSRMLFFFIVNEQRRLGPAGELNWAAILNNGQVEDLYLGARYNTWEESDYIQAYNRFLAETPGTIIPAEDDDGDDQDNNMTGEEGVTKRPGELNPTYFFVFAGLSFIALVVMSQLKKTR